MLAHPRRVAGSVSLRRGPLPEAAAPILVTENRFLYVARVCFLAQRSPEYGRVQDTKSGQHSIPAPLQVLLVRFPMQRAQQRLESLAKLS
jgi:hypothetical protein